MAIVDDRGRFLGRWSIIDVAVAGVVLVVVVMGYGALLLFRTPVPSLASITPTEILSEQAQTLFITGEDFRPSLNVRLGSLTAPLLVQNLSSAEVRVPGLPPGTYDLVLLDQARELVSMPGALTVISPPQIELQVVGAFVYLTEQEAARIQPGATLDAIEGQVTTSLYAGLTLLHSTVTESEIGEVLAVQPPEAGTQRLRGSLIDPSGAYVTTLVPDRVQVPAIIRFNCLVAVDRCKINERDVVREALVPVAVSTSGTDSSTDSVMYAVFRIDEVRASTTPPNFLPSEVVTRADAVVRVQFLARPEVLGLPMVGDEDFGAPTIDTAIGTIAPLRAVIRSIDTEPESIVSTTSMSSGVNTFMIEQPLILFEATLDVPVVLTPIGWQYADRSIKVGAPFRFEGATYAMDGWMIAVEVGAETNDTMTY